MKKFIFTFILLLSAITYGLPYTSTVVINNVTVPSNFADLTTGAGFPDGSYYNPMNAQIMYPKFSEAGGNVAIGVVRKYGPGYANYIAYIDPFTGMGNPASPPMQNDQTQEWFNVLVSVMADNGTYIAQMDVLPGDANCQFFLQDRGGEGTWLIYIDSYSENVTLNVDVTIQAPPAPYPRYQAIVTNCHMSPP